MGGEGGMQTETETELCSIFNDGATAQYEKTLCSLKHSELSQKPHCLHPGLYMPSVSGFAEVMEEEWTSMGNSLKVNERNPTYV